MNCESLWMELLARTLRSSKTTVRKKVYMRRRLVLWGRNADEKKILIGLELLDRENKVKLYVIPEEQATELFYTQMMNMWRDGGDILFPEETEYHKWFKDAGFTDIETRYVAPDWVLKEKWQDLEISQPKKLVASMRV